MPFQFALADAFTICDAYHCSMHSGTNPNRLFLWTGTNGPTGDGRRPGAIDNSDARLRLRRRTRAAPGPAITWIDLRRAAASDAGDLAGQVYQDVARQLRRQRAARRSTPSATRCARQPAGQARAQRRRRGAARARHRSSDLLRSRRAAPASCRRCRGSCATADGLASIPARPARPRAPTTSAKVLDALTANPEVWSKTVLLVNFDENDGFFDHVPPPAAPSLDPTDAVAGKADAGERVDGADDARVPRAPGRQPPATPRRHGRVLRPGAARADVRASRRGAAAAGSTRRCSTTPR